MKISVLTPCYNSGQYLERAIQSVIDQSYSNWEHIIVDGGSKDDTISILKRHNHLNWVSEPDKGQSDAMNKAFSKSTGDIIVYLNADDYFLPGAFEEAVRNFKENPDLDLVVGNFNMILPDGSSKIFIPSIEFSEILIYNRQTFPLNPVSYFYKRKVQEHIGSFPTDNHYSMDYWFLLRAYQNFKIAKTDSTLGVFVQDGKNKSFSVLESQKSIYKTWKDFTTLIKKDELEQAIERIQLHYIEKITDLIVKNDQLRNRIKNQAEIIGNSKWWRLRAFIIKVFKLKNF